MVDETRSSKDRSPNFPYIPLDAALQRASEFYAKEKRGSAPFSIAATHWRLSSLSSSALQTAAALKAYGLMSDEGRGAARKLRLTELALRIILDNRPDSAEKLEYMRQATRAPTVAAHVYSLWPDELPSSENLHHHLVLELKFNSENAHKVVSILEKNHELTGINSSEFERNISGDGGDMAIADSMTSMIITKPSKAINALPSTIDAHISAGPSVPVPAVTERLVFDDAIVTIQFYGPATAEVYGSIEEYGKFRKGLFKPK